jgi:CBS-domain-containing membrane protein
MIQIRLKAPRRREFAPDVYRPGVLSLARLVWGSLGGGLALAAIALAAKASGVGVLYPPLAATCFIGAACPHLRVARPRQVVAGHLISSVAGVLAVFAGRALAPPPSGLYVPLTLGLAVALAAMFMQLCDADHPPAAATAAIPAILPLPVDPWLLPLHMAWGGVIASLAALAWNRLRFDFPPPDAEDCPQCLGLRQNRAETAGLGLCLAATLLMALRQLSATLYQLGLALMAAGGLILLLQHFGRARLLCGDEDCQR